MFKKLQMQNKELQDETKANSEQMPIVPIPAQMPQNPLLAAVLDFLGIVQIISFCVLLIMSVWINDNIIRKLLITDLIAFVFTLIIYWLLCYTKKQAVHCG